MRNWIGLLAICAVLLPALVVAQNYYRYRTDSGSVAFTDDLDQIPARYRDSAEAVQPAPLPDYSRTTVSEPGAGLATTVTSLPDLEELTRQTAREPVKRRPVTLTGGMLSLGIADGVELGVPIDGDELITVRRELRWEDGKLLQLTIVRRGEKMIAEIASDEFYETSESQP